MMGPLLHPPCPFPTELHQKHQFILEKAGERPEGQGLWLSWILRGFSEARPFSYVQEAQLESLTAVHSWVTGSSYDAGWGGSPELLCPSSLGHKGQWEASSHDQTRERLYDGNLAQGQEE